MKIDKYTTESRDIARILEVKCPAIYAILSIIEAQVNKYEKIEIGYWTETYLHVVVSDNRFDMSIDSMRMGFSVDFDKDIVLYSQPYTKNVGFYSRSNKWNRILKKININFDKYHVVSISKSKENYEQKMRSL